MALGLFAEEPFPYSQQSLQLSPGDKIIMFTDGIYECLNASQRQFSLAEMGSFLDQQQALPVQQLLEELMQHITQFNGGRFLDDVTLAGYTYQPVKS